MTPFFDSFTPNDPLFQQIYTHDDPLFWLFHPMTMIHLIIFNRSPLSKTPNFKQMKLNCSLNQKLQWNGQILMKFANYSKKFEKYFENRPWFLQSHTQWPRIFWACHTMTTQTMTCLGSKVIQGSLWSKCDFSMNYLSHSLQAMMIKLACILGHWPVYVGSSPIFDPGLLRGHLGSYSENLWVSVKCFFSCRKQAMIMKLMHMHWLWGQRSRKGHKGSFGENLYITCY